MITPTSTYKDVKRHACTQAHTHTSSHHCITNHQTCPYEFISFMQKKTPPYCQLPDHQLARFNITPEYSLCVCVCVCVRACVCVCVWCGSSGGAIMADEWPSRKRSATLQGWCGETSSTHQLIKCQRVRLDRKREREREAGRRVWEGGGTQEGAADR